MAGGKGSGKRCWFGYVMFAGMKFGRIYNRGLPKPRRSSTGAALITAMLITGLAGVMIGDMLFQKNMDIRRTSGFFYKDQAYLYALSAEEGIMFLLLQDLKGNTGSDGNQAGNLITDTTPAARIDTLEEDWYQLQGFGNFKSIPIPDEHFAQLTIDLIDLQGGFNLNKLRAKKPEDRRYFAKLLADLLSKQDSAQSGIGQFGGQTSASPENLADALVEWLDEDSSVQTGSGEEDDYYSSLEKPYMAANSAMRDLSELAMVYRFDKALVASLSEPNCSAQGSVGGAGGGAGNVPVNSLQGQASDLTSDLPVVLPCITLLPESAPLNLNTASFEVLTSYGLDAAEIIGKREGGNLTNVSDALAGLKKPPDASNFSVHSEYFLVTIEASVLDSRLSLRSIIHRPRQVDANNPITVVQRNFAKQF